MKANGYACARLVYLRMRLLALCDGEGKGEKESEKKERYTDIRNAKHVQWNGSSGKEGLRLKDGRRECQRGKQLRIQIHKGTFCSMHPKAATTTTMSCSRIGS